MNKIEDIDFDNIDLSDFQEDVDDIRNDIKNIKKNKKLMKVLKKVEKKKDRDKKTILEIGLYAKYYKKDITDKYMINNKSLIITNDAIDILDKPQEKLYIEPWTKKIEKDKEIERLNKELSYYKTHSEEQRQELARLLKQQSDNIKHKKYTKKEINRLNNIIEELEKWLSSEYMSGNYEEYYRMGLKDSYNKLKELKEGK